MYFWIVELDHKSELYQTLAIIARFVSVRQSNDTWERERVRESGQAESYVNVIVQ